MIEVKCVCGWFSQVNDKYVGKTIKCPSCAAGVHVPFGDGPVDLGVMISDDDDDASPLPSRVAAPPPVDPPMLKVKCTCGHAFVVQPDLAGKPVRCPSCLQSYRCPAPLDAFSRSMSAVRAGSAFERAILARLDLLIKLVAWLLVLAAVPPVAGVVYGIWLAVRAMPALPN